eukprot:jgi/Botrbrau1/8567/Bobra.0359s0031.1
MAMASNPAEPFSGTRMHMVREHTVGNSREGRAGDLRSCVYAWVQWWATFTVFPFPTHELEAEFQQYLARSIGMSSWSFCVQITFAWLMFAQTLLQFPERRGALPPIWPLGALHGIAAASLAVLLLVNPAFFSAHHRVIKLAVICVGMLTERPASAVLLWRNSVTRPAAPSWTQDAKFFFAENISFVAQLLHVLGLPIGIAPDLLLGTAAMLVSMLGNRGICALPYAGDHLVTMAPGLLAVTQRASECLSGIWGLGVGVHPHSGDMSCPVALGFWQVVATVMAYVLVFVADVQRRRTFLRMHERLARAHFGSSFARAASAWPSLRPGVLRKVVLIGFVVVLMGASIAWNLALDFVI